jgi:hypothetical protein
MVFLFLEDVPRHVIESRAEDLCQDGYGPAHLLEVTIPDSIADRAERDRSFCGFAVIAFAGSIEVEEGCSILHVEVLTGRSRL